VVSRFVTYGIGVPGFAQAYMEALWEHEWMQQWIEGALAEEWHISQFEVGERG
jgi:glutathione S-transferase